MKPLIDEAELRAELAAIEGEAIGWTPLEPGAYLHVGDDEDKEIVIVGVADAAMVGSNVLLIVG